MPGSTILASSSIALVSSTSDSFCSALAARCIVTTRRLGLPFPVVGIDESHRLSRGCPSFDAHLLVGEFSGAHEKVFDLCTHFTGQVGRFLEVRVAPLRQEHDAVVELRFAS